jgi:hypothetical protein
MTRLVFYPLNWYQLLEEIATDDNKNKLVVLDNRQLSVLHSLVNLILPYYWIWGIEKTDSEGRTAISDFKEKLEADLMAVLNIDDLIKTNLMLVAALTGETIDRDHPENYMAGSYTPTGLTPTVELTNTALGTLDTTVSGALTTHNETFNSMLEQIELIQASLATMAGKSPDDLADDLEGIASTISTIATILGVVL